MYVFVVALHVVLCLLLVMIILLQPGKGGDPSSAFGGGMSTTVFGPRGPVNVLAQATTVVAVMFMVTSVTLALFSRQSTITDDDELQKLRDQQLEELHKASAAPADGTAPSTDGGGAGLMDPGK